MLDPARNTGSAREPWDRPTARVDWLEGSINPFDLLHGHQADDEWLLEDREGTHPPSGVRGYDRWQQDANKSLLGVREDFDPDEGCRIPYRCYLILKGTGLTDQRARDVDDLEVLQAFRHWGGRIRRIDLAVDVRHPDVTPRALRDLYYTEPSRIVTRLGTPRHWGRDQGETFYLGTGDVVLRVYDKTAGRARKGVPMADGVTRFEMQLRKRSAQAAYFKLVNQDRATWTNAFPEIVIGWLLDKMRPLDVPRPERNPQRAPLWQPLVEAMRNIGPVPLGRHERDRTDWQRIRAKADHHNNNRRTGKLFLELLGDAAFLQSVRGADLNAEDRHLLQMARETDPEMLSRILDGMFDLGDINREADTATKEGLFDEGR